MPLDVKIENTASGLPTAVVYRPDNEPVWLHSRRHPAQEGEELAATIGNDAGLVLVLGLGLGYHVHALAERLPQDSLILVLEKHPEVFEAGQACAAMPPLPANAIVIWEIDQIPAAAASYATAGPHGGMAVLEHPASLRLDPSFYRQGLERFRDAMRIILTNAHTINEIGYWFPYNLMANMVNLVLDPPVSRLEGLLKGHPAVMVASGPSLKKNIHHLAGLRGRVPIIAAGSAYEALTNAGIVPDFAVVVDPLPLNLTLFEGRGRDDVCLVYETMLYPPVVPLFPGCRFYGFNTVASRTMAVNLLRHQAGAEANIPSSGTVASTAFALAVLLGADPIIIVGQDLAFTDQLTHAPGLSLAQEVPPDMVGVVEVPAIGGGKVKTGLGLFAFLLRLQQQYKQAVAQGITVIDATEGGALKEHTVVMRLEEALRRHAVATVDVFARAREAYASYAPEPGRTRETVGELNSLATRLEHFEQELTTAVGQIMKIRRATQALESGRLGAHAGAVAHKIRAIFNDFYERNQRLAEEKDIMEFLDLSAFLPAYGRSRRTSNNDVNLLDKLEDNGMYYLEMVHNLKLILPPLRESIRKLEEGL